MKVRSAAITVEDLLHSLVAHLSSGEALQRHNGGVGPVTQQQLAGLDVTSQRRSMESCLTQSVHGIDLESERKRFLSFIPTTLPKTVVSKRKRKSKPLLHVSAAPQGYHCELSRQRRATES